MASPVRTGVESERAANEYGIIVCRKCQSSDWKMEGGEFLRCQSCRAGLLIRNGILDCLGIESPDSVDRVARQWDEHYGGRLGPYSASEDWWTLSCWKKHLFQGVIQDLRNKLIADFGCGTSSRIAVIAPMNEYGYRYVGIDSSLAALNRAASNLPRGLFIRANVGAPCLRPAVADVVLCLGVLMYFQDYPNVLNRFVNVLKPGGILLLHEQATRVSWGRLASLIFGTGRNRTPTGHGVHWPELRDNLAKHGKVVHLHLGGSPFRSVLRKLAEAVHLDSINSIVAGLDSIWCNTIGRVVPAAGAGEIQIVFRKA